MIVELVGLFFRFVRRRLTRPPEPPPDRADVAALFASLTGVDYETATGIFADGYGVARHRIRSLPQDQRKVAWTLFEFATQLARLKLPEREISHHKDELAEYLSLRYMEARQEVLGVLCLNVRKQLIGEAELFRGALERMTVDPKPIFALALDLGADAVVLYHTHPSGDPAPSSEDLIFTRRVVEAGKLLGIWVADHLIISPGGLWDSACRNGVWGLRR